jgi:DNA-directed RNA polymerase subunit L
MIKINKIDFKILNQDNELGDSRLVFNMKGSNINYIVMNTIRRTILSDIPILAFTNFKIDKNTSIFHNNYLKLRILHLPVWGIENTVNYINDKENKTSDNEEINFNNDNDELNDIDNINYNNDDISDNDEKNYNNEEINADSIEEINDDSNEDDNKKELSTIKHLSMFVNYKNKSNNIISVTTNDAKFYYDENIIKSPYKNNIQIVKLQPGQEITFTVITSIGTESSDTIYSAVSIATYIQNDPNNFDFIFESRGQLTEKRILIVAIINIIRRIKNFYKILKENKNSQSSENSLDEFKGTIEINNEDHTLGNLITRGLQEHKDVLSAGYNLPHPLIKKVIFNYSIKKDSNIKSIMKDVVDYYCELFEKIKKNFETIN